MTFIREARAYRNRFSAGLFSTEALRWLPGGAILAVFTYLFSIRLGFSPWISLPVLVLPSLAAGTAAAGRRSVGAALSWLDRETAGRQELQAAWEIRNTDHPLADEVFSAGSRVLGRENPRPPVPSPGPISFLAALVSIFIWLILVVAGAGLFRGPSVEAEVIGAEMQAWAEAWAEELPEDAESRELADRMGRLGRRIASGELGDNRSERALRELEEDIGERQEDLTRDKVADSLVDDLELDRKSAEAFRIGRKRLPADVLSELGDAVAGSTILGSEDRELLERLLSDPELRDNSGRGRPELTEELTDALDRALNSDDSLKDQLARAESETNKARMMMEGDDGAAAGRHEAMEDAPPSEPGESAQGNSGQGVDDETDTGDGTSGGSGRGSVGATDDGTGELPPFAADTAENPLRLPSPSVGSDSWKTVIRAYGEAGDTAAAGDAGALPAWEAELESVIGRDDIPPGVRDYVREYFLALESGAEIPENEGRDDAEQSTDNRYLGTTREE